MKITYTENPLGTIIELDEHEKKEMWYKIKIEQLEDRMFSAHYSLTSKQYNDIERAKHELDPDYYMGENDGEKSKLDERVDMIANYYIASLQSYHQGDCTCIACSCEKCHAEYLIGTNTTKGLGKHSTTYIESAFENDRSIDEALEYLLNYKFKMPAGEEEAWERVGGYEQHIPRWTEEIKSAYDWLLEYRNTHFNKQEDNSNE